MTDLLCHVNSDHFEEAYTGYGKSKWTNSTIAAFVVFQTKVVVFKESMRAHSFSSPR